MDTQHLVTVAEAARQLERSTEQVRRYLREGRLAGQRLGGQWFIDRSELAAFHEHLRATTGFLESIPPASTLDPLSSVIGIGAGGGANIAQGKNAYRRAFWWRR